MDATYKTDVNRDVPPARPGEIRPLALGKRLVVSPPVVLAPMAGVTNYPFRAICRRFGAEETPRSLQRYGVDPYYVGEAVKRLVGEGRVDHIDMNFGCPVRKVTSKGGGAAIPAKPRLLAAIVRAAVGSAGEVPVTLKF